MTQRASRAPDVSDLAALPRDEGGPVFQAPWEAQVFALALELHQAGHVTWTEWADRLASEIRRARERGDPDLGTTYYQHWLAALERMVADKGLLTTSELERRKAEWDAAARSTPHGQPIRLHKGPR